MTDRTDCAYNYFAIEAKLLEDCFKGLGERVRSDANEILELSKDEIADDVEHAENEVAVLTADREHDVANDCKQEAHLLEMRMLTDDRFEVVA
jgi:hypothetical protein